jgi:hypothetical protein
MQGIDISSNNHQGEVFNFADVKAAGYDTVYVKATQGNNYLNPYLIADVRDAANNGLKVGVYHFYDAAHGTPQQQADWFMRNGIHAPVGEGFGDLTEFLTLLPVLDLEQGEGGAVSPAILRDEFLNELALAHWRCGVYMNRDYLKNFGYGTLAAFGWLAWPGWTNEALPSVTAIVQTGQTTVQGIGISPTGAHATTDVDVILDLNKITLSAVQPIHTTERGKEMDAVVAPNGDIVSHIVSVDGHYLEVTRKAGTQGEQAPGNMSIIDVNDAFGSEKPVQP